MHMIILIGQSAGNTMASNLAHNTVTAEATNKQGINVQDFTTHTTDLLKK